MPTKEQVTSLIIIDYNPLEFTLIILYFHVAGVFKTKPQNKSIWNTLWPCIITFCEGISLPCPVQVGTGVSGTEVSNGKQKKICNDNALGLI